MRFFPPLERISLVWVDRMRALKGTRLREDDPTIVFMFEYLLSLDEQYDRQANSLRECICRAEEAEKQIRSLEVQLAKAKAQTALAESREAAAIEASKQAEDRHTQKIKDFYLVTRPKRRAHTLEQRECDLPLAPPLNNASYVISETRSSVDGKEILSLTQASIDNGVSSRAILSKDYSSPEACDQ